MKINDEIKIKTRENALNPGLIFILTVSIKEDQEIPIEFSGMLIASDGMILTDLREINANSIRYPMMADNGIEDEEQTIQIVLLAQLNEKIVDYIESKRNKDSKGDVQLKLEISAKVLRSRAVISPLYALEKPPFEIPSNHEGGLPIIYKYSTRYSSSRTNLWVISGKEGAEFLDYNVMKFEKGVIIKSNDWIHDYCPRLGIGNFIVFEFPIIDIVSSTGVTGKFNDKISTAIESIKKMKQYLIKAEWNHVMDESRAISELLRHETEIKNLFINNGYTEEAYNDLDESLQNLFNFASKFHHKIGRAPTKKLMSDIKTSKEDAYLIYTISIAIVNSITRKIERTS